MAKKTYNYLVKIIKVDLYAFKDWDGGAFDASLNMS